MTDAEKLAESLEEIKKLNECVAALSETILVHHQAIQDLYDMSTLLLKGKDSTVTDVKFPLLSSEKTHKPN